MCFSAKRQAGPVGSGLLPFRGTAFLDLFHLSGRFVDVEKLHLGRIGLRSLEAVDRLQLLRLRQVAEPLQAEVDEEFLRRLVEERSPDDLLPPGRRDQLPAEESSDRGGGVHGAQLGDLRPGYRLPVGHDRQNFQGRLADVLGQVLVEIGFHQVADLPAGR